MSGPDPPTLARETPQKARVLLFAEPLKSLKKKGKAHEKRKKKRQENRGTKKARRSKKAKDLPDPPILAFLEKARVFPQKSKGFSLRGTPKILGTERKNAQKSKENRENEKSKEIEKSKDWRVRAKGGPGLTPSLLLGSHLYQAGGFCNFSAPRHIETGAKDPHPQDFSLTKKTARFFTKGQFRPY